MQCKTGAVGIRRGYGTTVSRRARSDRSSVTVKKKRRAETAVDARRLHADPRLVQLEETQVFRCRRVGRPADKGRECSDVSHIVASVSSLKPRTVMSSIMRARSGLTGRGEVSEVIGAPLPS